MTFEEQLNRAFETLTERLRGEIDQHVQRVSAELVAAAPYDRAPTLLDAAREELARAVAAARQEAHEAGVADGRDAVREEANRELANVREAADRELTQAREEADRELARVREAADRELAEAREDARRGSPDAVVPAAQSAEAGLEQLADSIRAIDAARSLTEVLDTLVTVASCDASGVEIWLVHGGQLYRWPASGNDAGHRPAPRSLEAAGAIAEAVRSNATARDEDLLAVPIALAGQVVAVFSANRDTRTENLAPRTGNLELLVRYTAKSLEALTAFRTARALTQLSEPASADASPVAPDESSEEDTSARRYARLLVSEIRLYHESAVVDGCRDRDLATRLGGEIARARAMYEQRVAPHVRERADHFHDELVRTLAGGDASLLEFRSQNSELGT